MSELSREQQRERVRRRVRAATDPDSYEYFPGKDPNENLRGDVFQRVGVYARVSTPDPSQTSSFELQQKYYTDLIERHENWVFVKIYADEGKSGTTTEHREEFNEMIKDAMEGRLDLIITKSISRFSRNTEICLKMIRKLTQKKVGVFFESEMIYSLNDTNHLALSFSASVAEEESRIRSRSMESSLRMRLDHGLPLTPELLGFIKDEEGKLRINPETYKIPKLMFSMYLYGYSTQKIADVLTRLSKKTYLGNMKWSAGGIADSLKNERYCGDVRTRKRYKIVAADVDEEDGQKSFKNRGEKPQSYYKDEHDAIVSRDDYIAVQRIMNNAKYGGTSLLPCLNVIPDGLLKGFVIVHPKWGSFTKEDYFDACRSVDDGKEEEVTIEAEAGSFDFRDYEIVDFKLFNDLDVPAIMLKTREIHFSISCIRKMDCDKYIELLVHPIKKQLAIRPTTKDNRYGLEWYKGSKKESRTIACQAFIRTLYQIFGWNQSYKYKLYGRVYREGKESACVFSEADSSVYINKEEYLATNEVQGEFLDSSGNRFMAVAGDRGERFGQSYYEDQNRSGQLTKEEWQTQIKARMCEPKEKLSITPYDVLREFILQEMGQELFEEVQPDGR